MFENSRTYGKGRRIADMNRAQAYTFMFFTGGFLILYKIIRPLNKYRASVMALCILGILLTINIMPNFFAIKEISGRATALVTLFAIAEFALIRWITLILEKLISQYPV